MITTKMISVYKILKSCLLISIITSTICIQSTEAQEQKDQYMKQVKEAVIFADIGGSLHGIAFDDKGSMYVGKNGKEILKIAPDGSISPFVVVKEALGYFNYGPGDTFIYDMEFGRDQHLYVAAEDRVLKITPAGEIQILLQQKFTGTWGTCGIALDQNDNIYISFDDKILKLLPSGERSIFIDSKKIGFELYSVVGLEFDSLFSNLYVCDGYRGGTGKLIRVPIKPDGSPGGAQVIFKKNRYRPEYVCIDHSQKQIVTKGPENPEIVLLKDDLTPIMIELKNVGYEEIETIAFGQEGFSNNSIYGTGWFGGKVYRIDF